MGHKCYICRKVIAERPIPDDGSVYYGGIDLWFCSLECFRKYIQKQAEQEAKDSVYATLHRVFNYSGQFETKIHVEIQRTLKDLNLSYFDLNRVLHYMYDIERIPIYKPTLYYVKDHVYAAKKYYKEIEKHEEQMRQMKASVPPIMPIGRKPSYKRPAPRKLLMEEEEDL